MLRSEGEGGGGLVWGGDIPTILPIFCSLVLFQPLLQVIQHELVLRRPQVNDAIRIGLLVVGIVGDPAAEVDHQIGLHVLLASPGGRQSRHAWHFSGSIKL